MNYKYKITKCPKEFSAMALSQGKISVHRLIVAKKLGRSLGSEEIVHHVDGNTLNNNFDNLVILTKSEHSKLHHDPGPNGIKRTIWNFRVEPELFIILKKKGRNAAAWVRSALWETLNKQEAK
jgi:hypothetical protein